jgi:hypothetical protein
MAKKQTRRSISVSRTTYERLKAFCEANNVSMSQLVETRVNDFLGEGSSSVGITPITPRPTPPSPPRPLTPSSNPPKATTSTSLESAGYHHAPSIAASSPSTSTQVSSSSSASYGASASSTQPAQPAPRPTAPVVPMTSAAARYAVEPPPPIIKPKQQDTNAPKPAEKRPDQIFTF